MKAKSSAVDWDEVGALRSGYTLPENAFTRAQFAAQFNKSLTTATVELKKMVKDGKLKTARHPQSSGGVVRIWWKA